MRSRLPRLREYSSHALIHKGSQLLDISCLIFAGHGESLAKNLNLDQRFHPYVPSISLLLLEVEPLEAAQDLLKNRSHLGTFTLVLP